MPLDPHPLIVNADLSNFCLIIISYLMRLCKPVIQVEPGRIPQTQCCMWRQGPTTYPYDLHMYKKQKPCMTHSTLKGIKTTACLQRRRPLSEVQAVTCVTTLFAETS